MRAQRIDRMVVPCQLRLGQRRMDFFVADVVKQNRGPAFAAFELWDQVMKALLYIRWHWTVTKWANRIGHLA